MSRINFNDVEYMHPDAGGGHVYYYQGVPFTGTVEEFYLNGVVSGEIECIDGHADGASREFYDSGQIKEEYFEKYNRLYGNYKRWDANGTLISHTVYDNDGNLIRRVV